MCSCVNDSRLCEFCRAEEENLPGYEREALEMGCVDSRKAGTCPATTATN